MKILVIGDLHGSDKWKIPYLYALEHFVDKIIFIGDYVDSYNINSTEILDNLKDIIELKKKFPNIITLLIGNHDYAYLFGLSSISGYNFNLQHDYKQLFNDNWDLFDLAWGYGGDYRKQGYGEDKYTLITHAGLTKTYWEKFMLYEINEKNSSTFEIFKDKDIEKLQLHEIINYFKNNYKFLWKVGSERGGSGCGSILWADKNELLSNPLKGINQIIGHTGSKYIEKYKKDEDDLYFIDVHDYDNCIGTLMLNL